MKEKLKDLWKFLRLGKEDYSRSKGADEEVIQIAKMIDRMFPTR